MEYSENPIRVLIIEQDRLAVAKLRAILEIDKKMIQVASIDRISSGMNILYEKGWSQSDVVIIQGDSDIDNLGKTIEEIKRYFSTSKILLLMRETNYAYAMEALSTGVFGIIMNDLNNYNIHYAVRSLARGGVFLTPNLVSLVLKNGIRTSSRQYNIKHIQDLFDSLTLKELQIVHFIADGLSNKVIAEKLFITYSSVRRDISKILRKLHMHSRAEIISN